GADAGGAEERRLPGHVGAGDKPGRALHPEVVGDRVVQRRMIDRLAQQRLRRAVELRRATMRQRIPVFGDGAQRIEEADGADDLVELAPAPGDRVDAEDEGVHVRPEQEVEIAY